MPIVHDGQYVDVDGIRTYYVKRGSGPAIVMFHGQAPGASAHLMWEMSLDYFAHAGYAVYAIDEVGFGRTDKVDDCSMGPRVAHARGFLQAMGLDRYTLWGHSDGSYIASTIALDDPKVDHLILMASGTLSPRNPNDSEEAIQGRAERRASYTPSRENARGNLLHSFANAEAVTDELVDEMLAMSEGENYEAFTRRSQAPHPKPIYDDLRALKLPVLVLWGRSDSGGPLRGLLLSERIPGAEFHVFDQCGHWVQRDQPARVNSIVCDFLRSR
ncbi:MAG: 2-hydroxymuconate-semialdehyde hydrolase [Chloroflexota bacterium]|jgi:2-hydroxy-6-oxonona-2,4-dienedioate hydrolase|nr:2-hydroxymuconate-semialdehyde hydrolase [Chloroflexota bacterium]